MAEKAKPIDLKELRSGEFSDTENTQLPNDLLLKWDNNKLGLIRQTNLSKEEVKS